MSLQRYNGFLHLAIGVRRLTHLKDVSDCLSIVSFSPAIIIDTKIIRPSPSGSSHGNGLCSLGLVDDIPIAFFIDIEQGFGFSVG